MALLDDTLGAAFVGMLAACNASIFHKTLGLYGVTSVQTFLYFHDFKEDGKRMKSMVLFLWIIDTIHLIFTCHGLYFYLVTNFGNFIALLTPTWTILAQVYLTNISDLTVRVFFARRVFILCGPREFLARALVVLIIVLSFVTFSFGCGFASRAFILKSYANLNQAAAMLYISFACAVVADTTIAVSLCTLLLKSRTGIRRTDSLVTTLMAFSINTGLLTSVCAIACFVTYAIWPQKFIFMGIYFALSKLYINALLASLNARSVLRSHNYGVSMSSMGPNGRHSHVRNRAGVISTSIAFPKIGSDTKDSFAASHSIGSVGSMTTPTSPFANLKNASQYGGVRRDVEGEIAAKDQTV